MDHDHPPIVESPGIVDRPQADRGIAGRIVPVLALGLMLLMVLQSCLSTPLAPPSNAAAPPVPAAK